VNSRVRALIALFPVLLAAAAFSGCDKSKAAALPTVTTASTEPATTTTLAPVIAPLTGLTDSSRAAGSRAALVVKVENSPDARPQAGLDLADVVYEEVVEGGITRFLAVFQSGITGDDAIGPVRSVRPMDPGIVTPLHPLFAYAGGTKPFIARLHSAPVQDVGWDAVTDAYYKAKGRAAPHNLFTHASDLWKAAKSSFKTPPNPLFTFLAAGAPFGGTPATAVTIPFSAGSTASYAWDPAASAWKRSQNGTAHTVMSGAQIAPANVVVLVVREQVLTNTDAAGNRVPEAITTGTGDAWVLSQGQVVKGRWSRASTTGVAQLTNAAGAPIALTPGKTWVHFAPTGTAVTVK
jgi:hypothetical protein